MIKEVIVVEGKMDVFAVRRAVEADCIITDGYKLLPHTKKNIIAAYKSRGIIILTDPDTAGERIRARVSKLCPKAKHAFVSVENAYANNDIGIEQASPMAIREALAKVHTLSWKHEDTFSQTDLILNGLNGTPEAQQRRYYVGEILGLGFANAKTFLNRLNSYGISREQFTQAVASINSGENEQLN